MHVLDWLRDLMSVPETSSLQIFCYGWQCCTAKQIHISQDFRCTVLTLVTI